MSDWTLEMRLRMQEWASNPGANTPFPLPGDCAAVLAEVNRLDRENEALRAALNKARMQAAYYSSLLDRAEGR